MRTFVIGDIHGAHKALVQCLSRSGFDYHHDHLISLGDVCDGWPEIRESVDELLKIKKLTYILGNHDFWTLQWMRYGQADDIWLNQGGAATVKSYNDQADQAHLSFLEKALPYFILDKKGEAHNHTSLFVHAGFNPLIPIEQQSLNIFLWDRNLSRMALDFYNKGIDAPLTKYDEVYIGHTPVDHGKPVFSCGVWLMDTGAGWSGVLSMMDVDTKEITQSDPVPMLYPRIEGRSRN